MQPTSRAPHGPSQRRSFHFVASPSRSEDSKCAPPHLMRPRRWLSLASICIRRRDPYGVRRLGAAFGLATQPQTTIRHPTKSNAPMPIHPFLRNAILSLLAFLAPTSIPAQSLNVTPAAQSALNQI